MSHSLAAPGARRYPRLAAKVKAESRQAEMHNAQCKMHGAFEFVHFV
jgi:hypothetical protein